MIGTPPTDTLEAAVISGVVHRGLSVRMRDGKPARLAIVDEDGQVVECGAAVERECFNVAVQVYRNFWIGQGHLTVETSPSGVVTLPQKPKSRARG
jgi:hypothetical protein